MIFTQNPLTKATGSSLLIPMSRSFAGRLSETHRTVPPRPNPPDRMVLHVSASTRAAAPSGLAHAPSPQGGARDAAAELIYLVLRGMEAACAEADSNAQVANSPARRATVGEQVTRFCDRRRSGRPSWLQCSHRPAARLGELGRYGAFSVWRAWGGRKPRRGKASQGKSRYLHTVARRLAGRSGLAGAVTGRPGFCGRGRELGRDASK